jgi:hypothetical protein
MDMPLGLDIREGKYCRWKTQKSISLLFLQSAQIEIVKEYKHLQRSMDINMVSEL